MNGLAVIAVFAFAFFLSTDIPGFAATNNLTQEQATQTTMKVKNGSVSKVALEKLDGQLIWNVRIDNTSVYSDPLTDDVVQTVETGEGK